jgi:crossover junction endodeoxyribonuclease RuvC
LRVLGIDPGTRSTGWGAVDGDRRGCRLVGFGCLRPRRSLDRPHALHTLAEGLEKLLTELEPDVAVVETPFAARYPRAALALAEARGVLLAILGRWNGRVVEYEPARVKAAIVGLGRADKKQVAFIVRQELRLDEAPPADAADALALAMCFLRIGSLDVEEKHVLPSGGCTVGLSD